MNRIPVSVLGATGVVGQRFVRRLASHPYFDLRFIAASERNVGKTYADACEWRLPGIPYAGFAGQKLLACDPDMAAAPIVFSALDANSAREIEPLFAAAGCLVFSNAAAFRMEEDVPLVMPEINPDHLQLLHLQRARRGWTGGIVCNPNCTTTISLGAIGPLHRAFGAEGVLLTSMQALSGAGYPGVSAMDSTGNVIPYIAGEEAKVEAESRRILGTLSNGFVKDADFQISAQCNRVPVLDGHTICLSLRLSGRPDAAEIAKALDSFVAPTATMALPSAPNRFISLRNEPDRPQPRRDVEDDSGMTMHVGRIRNCPVMGVKLVVLGHNVERGAAGGSLLNAELAVVSGFLPGFRPADRHGIVDTGDKMAKRLKTFRELQYTSLVPNPETRGQDVSASSNDMVKELETWTQHV
ncbi:MAG: aspartate-semialdehyde dehydrogenase [Spirochaetota bacterium]